MRHDHTPPSAEPGTVPGTAPGTVLGTGGAGTGPIPGGPRRRRSADERVRAARAVPERDRGQLTGNAPADAPVPPGPGPVRSEPPGDAEPQETRGAGNPDAATHEAGLELVARLGEGDGTRTWLARERSTREEFTVTFAVSEDPERRRGLQRQFTDLVAGCSCITPSHLVSVRATLGEQGRAEALVTDHVAARSLAERMRTEGRLAPQDVAPVLRAVARALAELHEHGWVHARLSPQHVLLTEDGRVLVDGYGAPSGADGPGPAWGLGERDHAEGPEPAAGAPDSTPVLPAEPPTAAADVYALGVLGWRALTGRRPGPDSHRVPLTLMCPTAPRPLVLMLEAALADDPASRPSARELAAGLDTAAPPPRPARRPPERMTPEVIRADGTVERSRRLRRARAERGHSRQSRRPQLRRAERSRPGTGSTTAASSAGGTSALTLAHPPRRVWLVLGAGVLVTAAVWGVAQWQDGAGSAEQAPAASSTSTDGSGATAGTTGGERAGDDASGARGSGSPAPSAGATDRGGATAAPGAPGASMADRDREAQQAVRDLVAARAAALAAGDESAVAAVYVPGSRLAARDQDLIRRAAEQTAANPGSSAFSGLSMETTFLAEERPRGQRLSPAEAARTRTYRAVVLTRGWRGTLPSGSSVTGGTEGARQALRISVVQTPQGWRLADVTPLQAGG
ncbi:protein kinase [Kocuria sp.]|uniref:serine/threonine protein kinase n=1 Tax=Kocuria sp. TaxID=1871328 RepID=UPI0026DCE30F|nr:protein kinase [Kocuria sp.]MDO4919809.1 protein kinase [Kocuria sp.]